MGMSLRDALHRMGMLKVIDPMIEEAYEIVEAAEDDSSPHGQPWHTSFHASSFPAGRERPCGRLALYEMMETPSDDPVTPPLRALMDVGKDVELHIMQRMWKAGFLLTDPDSPHQLGFEDEEHWLTGNTDGIALLKELNRGHVIETKGKDHDKITAMKQGTLAPDPYHVAQLKCYIGKFHDLASELWPELDGIYAGSLIYFSRQRPRYTAEFVYEYDPAFMEEGYAFLKQWKQNYINDELPQRDASWRWTETPCDWCPFKRDVCKPDHKAGVTKLTESHLVKVAKAVDPSYDPEQVRQRVFMRWNHDDKEKANG